MAVREKYVERLVKLFKEYMKSGHTLDTFEEVRYQASQLGKKLFEERIPLDWIVGLYIEAVTRLKSETREEEALDLANCGELLLEMVMAYSISFLRNLEPREQTRESEKMPKRIAERNGDPPLDPDGPHQLPFSSDREDQASPVRRYFGKIGESHV